MKKLLKSSVIIAMVALVAMLAVSCSSSKPFKTVDEYAKSDEVQSFLESESFGDSIEAQIYGEGNTLVFEYKFTTQIDEELFETTKPEVEAALKAESNTFVEFIDEMIELVDINKEDATVAVRYLNADGTVLLETVFNAES